MKYTKWFAGMALAAGMVMMGTGTASAEDWRDLHYDRQDVRRDYARVDAMQADISRDRVRLNEDIRCGRDGAAARDAADLARDQRRLQAQYRDIRSDRRDIRRDESYRYGWR